MKFLEKGFRLIDNIRVRYKLLGLYIAVILVPIVFVGLYLNYGMREVVLNNTLNETNANIDKLEMRLNAIFDRATSISDLIYINEDIETLINKEYQSNKEVYQAYNKYPIFDEYLKYYNEIETIRFYMTKDMITNSLFVYANQKVRNEEWYKQAVDKKGRISWIYKTDLWTKESYLTLSRAVYDSNNRLLGVLNIYISPDVINEVFKNEVYDAFITLDNEVIVHNKDSSEIGKEAVLLKKEKNLAEETSYIIDTEYMDEQVKIYVRSFQPKKSLDNSIQVSAIIPVKEVVSEADNVLIKGFAIIIGCVLMSLTLLILFIRSFDRRINVLKQAMNKVSKGDFNITENIAGKDEIGEVYRELNITINSIKKLINEVYIHRINEETYKRKQKESEFKMLSSQINPHFLYNTLEMIRMKAVINKDTDVANIVKLLSKVMRSSLETTDRPIPLETELDLVKTYLQIQKLRFGDKIGYDIKVESNINDYYVFPLLLQPIVENSVIHGIESKEGKGEITIHLFEIENHLVLKVADNGIGIEETKLKCIMEQLNHSEEVDDTATNRIGLFNVHQRIKLHYGDRYGVHIESNKNKGTAVTLYLPIWKGEDHDDA